MAAAGGSAVVRALEKPVADLIEKALAECADLARSEVLLRHRSDFAGPSPTREECKQQVKDATGRRVTRAMQLGMEMHQVALKCAEEKLARLRPGGFSLEPRYRYDRKSGETQLVSEEAAQALRESGNGGELQGTLVPEWSSTPETRCTLKPSTTSSSNASTRMARLNGIATHQGIRIRA
jgi:hypothetical protein